MKRVILTGASGFIGRHTLEGLLERGFEVHAVSSQDICNGIPMIHWHKIDLLAPGEVSGLVSRVQPTHLLHFAWATEPQKYRDSLENVEWVQASIDLMRQFARHGGQRMVMAGTCAEYDWQHSYCVEGKTPLIPSHLYGVCKHALQMILHEFAKQAGISAAWGRIFFLFGPYEKKERLIPSIICSMLRDEPIRCAYENWIREYSYVQDVADAFVALLESEVTGPVNIASGYSISIKDIIDRIAHKLNKEDCVRMEPSPSLGNEPHKVVADVTRLKKMVGWLPKYNFEKGLDLTILWWARHIARRQNEICQ